MPYTIKIDNFTVKADPNDQVDNKFNKVSNLFVEATDVNPIPASDTLVPNSGRVISVTEPTDFRFSYGCRFQMNITMNVVLKLRINGVDVAPDIFEAKDNSGGIEHTTACKVYRTTLPTGNNVIQLYTASSTAGASVCAAVFWDAMPVKDF